VWRARNGVDCAVINLQGRTYMAPTDCPFRKADQILGALDPAIKVRFVDFHAEATSEEDRPGLVPGRPRLSGDRNPYPMCPRRTPAFSREEPPYQTDCGMTGPYHSVIGVQTDIVIQRFLTGLPVRMEAARQHAEMHAVIVEVDENHRQRARHPRHAINGD